MKEYWVDFEGSVRVYAESAEKAEETAREMLDTYWDETHPVHFMNVENVEEIK